MTLSVPAFFIIYKKLFSSIIELIYLSPIYNQKVRLLYLRKESILYNERSFYKFK